MTIRYRTLECDLCFDRYTVNKQVSIALIGADTKENRRRHMMGVSVVSATVVFPWMTFSRDETALDGRLDVIELLERQAIVERTGNFLMHNQWGLYCPIVKVLQTGNKQQAA